MEKKRTRAFHFSLYHSDLQCAFFHLSQLMTAFLYQGALLFIHRGAGRVGGSGNQSI
jgi:hypothetical protein